MQRVQTAGATRRSTGYLPIEEYGLIGNLHTVALVGKHGSIDWCCLPRFDATSVFGALLNAEKEGYFRIAPPEAPGMEHKQLYLPDTNILITRFLAVDGVGSFQFLPMLRSAGKHSPLLRRCMDYAERNRLTTTAVSSGFSSGKK